MEDATLYIHPDDAEADMAAMLASSPVSAPPQQAAALLAQLGAAERARRELLVERRLLEELGEAMASGDADALQCLLHSVLSNGSSVLTLGYRSICIDLSV